MTFITRKNPVLYATILLLVRQIIDRIDYRDISRYPKVTHYLYDDVGMMVEGEQYYFNEIAKQNDNSSFSIFVKRYINYNEKDNYEIIRFGIKPNQRILVDLQGKGQFYIGEQDLKEAYYERT